ncbi:MAG TPA: PqiC family protein [Candidatus Sulfotelmatobacter sp.]|jgi:uncharacterized lipoprotein YmbA|nr:PqiC family protein [Candidatus Sulfotelmatobacter sp.]
MIARRGLPVLLAAALLAGCAASPPTRYHALVQPPQAVSGGSAKLLVELLPIAVPERLNRDEMVLTGADGSIAVRDGDHWAAPLSDEIRQMVADALWRRNAAADQYKAPVPTAASRLPQYRMSVRIERFDAGKGRPALVDASWSVRRLPEGEAAVCRASFSQGSSAETPDAAAQALSAATAQLAEAIAVSLERLNLGLADKCP